MAPLNLRTLWVPAVTGSLVALIVVAFVSASGASPWAFALAPLAAVVVVALHELAHVLDFGDGPADGLPAGGEFMATAPWVNVVAARLKKVRKRKYRHVLRDYAGTNEAELFAVAVEAFYERPTKLRARDPELYKMLREYFRVDPAEMFRGPAPK